MSKLHTKYAFDNDCYNFNKLLINQYKKKFPLLSDFKDTHVLLDTLNDDDKMFYSKPYNIFGMNDRNSIFVKTFYHFFDTDYSFLKLYLNFITNNIKPLFPKEEYILVQKTPNIRFHLPGYSNIGKIESDPYEWVIGLHKDENFNHPKEEWNFILPITKMYDTNSIYYEEIPNSKQSVEEYKSFNLNKNEFYKTKLNSCYHYNKINSTSDTRVSFDFRVVPGSTFTNNNLTSATSNIKFVPGKYYMYI